MKPFVFWTGIISVASGIVLQFPFLTSILMPLEQPGMSQNLMGLMAIFIGITLVICSRDLKNRGQIVVWEGVIRLFGFAIMAGYGIFGGKGISLVVIGLFDLVVGVIYLIAIPRHLGVSLKLLIFDKQGISL